MPIQAIERRKGRTYRVRVWVNGKRVSRNFERKIDALQFEQRVRISPVEVRSMTFANAAQEWLTNHAEVRKAKSSIMGDKTMLKLHILPMLGKIMLHTIRPNHIDQLIRHLKDKQLSDATVDKNLQTIKAVFNFHVKRGVLFYNPMSAIRMLHNKEVPFKFWSRGDAQTFLEHSAKKHIGSDTEVFHLLYKVALNTGMRQGELIALKWNAVDLDRSLITVCRTYDKHTRGIVETTKGRKIRVIPIEDAIHDDMAKLKAKTQGELVFQYHGRLVDPDNLYHRHFLKDVEESGVERIRFHDLRHTFASHYMMNGGNRFELQKFLGHSDAKLTERYAHLSLEYIAGKTNIVNFTEKDNVVRVNFQRSVNQ